MYRLCLCCCLIFGILRANQFDYLLFSHIVSDVQSGFELKADVNARWQGKTPLYTAVQNNSVEITYLLIMAGADVNALNFGESALHLAVRNQNPYITQLLISAGAKVNTKDERYGNTPLHYAALNNDRQTLNILTNANGDMNIQNFDGMTPAQAVVSAIMIPPMIIEDNNVAISASAFPIANGYVTFNVRNLTNEPLILFNTGLYVNGVLIAKNSQPLTIPAGTTITNINTMSIRQSALHALKADENGKLELKAGFSIDYQAEGRMEQVFNSTTMQLQLWSTPPKKQPKPRDSKSKE